MYLQHITVTVVDGRFHGASGVQRSRSTSKEPAAPIKSFFPLGPQSDIHNPLSLYPFFLSLSASVLVTHLHPVSV